jgi:hypothetical protein
MLAFTIISIIVIVYLIVLVWAKYSDLKFVNESLRGSNKRLKEDLALLCSLILVHNEKGINIQLNHVIAMYNLDIKDYGDDGYKHLPFRRSKT